MEIVLLQDVKSLGKKGEVVKVNDGYARNCILRKKLGVEANASSLNDLKLKKQNVEKVAAEQLANAKSLGEKIDRANIKVGIKVGKDGKTFGSVSTKEIVNAVKDQLGVELDKKKITLNENIKTVGTHEVVVKLHKNVTAIMLVKVVAEN